MSPWEKLRGSWNQVREWAGDQPVLQRRWEWGRDDLRKRVVDELCRLAEYGSRGEEVLPPTLMIRFTVANGQPGTVQRFLEDPSFDREVENELLNRLTRSTPDTLPARSYIATAGTRDAMEVIESTAGLPTMIRLDWETADGDRILDEYPLPAKQRSFAVGRGRWHGRSDGASNDVDIPEEARFVSRRAARIQRSGSRLRVRSLDQGEYLRVFRKDRYIRPARAASGAVEVEIGDHIEFNDGKGQRLLLHILSNEGEE